MWCSFVQSTNTAVGLGNVLLFDKSLVICHVHAVFLSHAATKQTLQTLFSLFRVYLPACVPARAQGPAILIGICLCQRCMSLGQVIWASERSSTNTYQWLLLTCAFSLWIQREVLQCWKHTVSALARIVLATAALARIVYATAALARIV